MMHRVERSPSARTAGMAVTLAVLLVWPLALAVRNGLSGVYAQPAIHYLEQKRFATDTVADAQWRALENSISQAAKLMPGNPRYLEALGRMHQIKLSEFEDALTIGELDAHANAAQAYFSRAIENRPTWPYYWGNLTLEHYRRGRIAAEDYGQALANAARFGPWKNDTQRLVMDLGSASWELLKPDARHEVVLNIERGLHRQPQNTLQIVREHGAWAAVCAAGGAMADVALPHLATLCARAPFAQSIDQF